MSVDGLSGLGRARYGRNPFLFASTSILNGAGELFPPESPGSVYFDVSDGMDVAPDDSSLEPPLEAPRRPGRRPRPMAPPVPSGNFRRAEGNRPTPIGEENEDASAGVDGNQTHPTGNEGSAQGQGAHIINIGIPGGGRPARCCGGRPKFWGCSAGCLLLLLLGAAVLTWGLWWDASRTNRALLQEAAEGFPQGGDPLDKVIDPLALAGSSLTGSPKLVWPPVSLPNPPLGPPPTQPPIPQPGLPPTRPPIPPPFLPPILPTPPDDPHLALFATPGIPDEEIDYFS